MNIGIIGLGLMGGSFGRTLVKKTEHKVFGYDVNADVMLKAEMMKAFHEPLTDDNADKLDMLVVAIRPEYFKSAVEKFIPRLKNGAIVHDFCGIKRVIINQMKDFNKQYPNLIFVGGHPMAGRELSGISHSLTTLYDKASMILVNVNADIFTIDFLKNFYISIGFSKVVITTAENHDAMIAYTSQLCHVVSNAFIKNEQAEKHTGYSAGSYRDLTRVARLDADMWAGLMIENKDMLLSELDELLVNLTAYRDAIRDGDENKLRELLKDGSDRKLQIDVKTAKTEK